MINKIIGFAALLALIAIMVFYVKEFNYFNRTLHGGRLALHAALAGLAVGAILGGYLAWRVRSSEDRVPVFFAGLLFCAFFGPLAGSLSNRLLAAPEVEMVSAEFHLEEAYYAELYGFLRGKKKAPAGYRTFFYMDGRLKKIQTRTPMFPDKRRGDTVQVPLQQGLWGFSFVPMPNT
jgi:MFS family permease